MKISYSTIRSCCIEVNEKRGFLQSFPHHPHCIPTASALKVLFSEDLAKMARKCYGNGIERLSWKTKPST
ncbi:hypothetical protein [Pedobacter sp. GR22-6]|uniref:hypothetical protein n=1 Tax=Pedobacter sp. GR22-6 TaxID=3127957 RepID=UPI00307ECBB6